MPYALVYVLLQSGWSAELEGAKRDSSDSVVHLHECASFQPVGALSRDGTQHTAAVPGEVDFGGLVCM